MPKLLAKSESAPAKTSAEQRKFSRIGYKQVQRIASYAGNRAPLMDDFVEVRCNDVSRGGLSFYADEVPEFTDFIVELTAREVIKYFFARVSNIRQNTNRKQKPVIVGCRFAGPAPVPERRQRKTAVFRAEH